MKKFTTVPSANLAREILPFPRPLLWFVMGLCFLHCVCAARANVYATNIRLNNGATNTTIASGGSVAIGYILNEDATAGITVAIKTGGTTARTISIATGSPGALRGTNNVVWDGRDDIGHAVAGGTYSISITAAATGFSDWTQTSVEGDPGNYAAAPTGIAINKNPNSLFYGRVFVANSQLGPHPEINPGDEVGILKLNADASAAQEGVFSGGGYPWAGDGLNPWKVEVSDDDLVYVGDFSTYGFVVSFDQTISSNSLRAVLRDDNRPNGSAVLSGPFITGTGTNTQVWMADVNPGGVGIRLWNASTNGVIATNDPGATVVPGASPSGLSAEPWDVAVDKSNRIYTIQNRFAAGDPAFRVFRFPASGGTVADWKIGSGDDSLRNANGIAVDPSAAYVAVALRAPSGTLRVFYASNGTPVTALPPHDYTDVAWDNVGNLYATDNADSTWRAFSPPGSNQATTVSLPMVQVQAGPIVPPVLSSPSRVGNQFQFTLNGEANVTYIILVSTNLQNWVPVATNSSVYATRTITVPAPADQSYYRAVVGPYSPARPVLSQPVYSGGQFHFTLTGEAYVRYVIWASSNLTSWVSAATNSAPTAVRQISITAPASQRFYRALIGP